MTPARQTGTTTPESGRFQWSGVGATCLPHPALRGSLRVGGRGGVRGEGNRRVVCRVPFWGFRGVLGARGGASRGDVGAGQWGKVRWGSGGETSPVGPVVPAGVVTVPVALRGR